MKKPDPEKEIIRLSIQLWREELARDDAKDEDVSVQTAKEILRREHVTDLAEKIKLILKVSPLTKNQLKVFGSYVETCSVTKTAEEFGISKQRVDQIVQRVRVYVKKGLEEYKQPQGT